MTQILQELSIYSVKLVDSGLVVGAGGNLSARKGKYMYISPSGFDLKEVTENEWVKVEIDSGKVLSDLKPSSELEMHLECYRKDQSIQAVLHAHPTYSVAVSSTGKEIPPMFPDYPAMVKSVSYIDYVIPTTNLIAEKVGEVVADSQAIVMRNHGVLTVGTTVKEAYFYMQLTEEAAKVYAISLAVGNPRTLTEQECDDLRNLSAETYRSSLLKK
ncbi:class II aldolase/adducin family protein [Oceanobacillus manasiensis]|uniref:class II aldolase/adducin family protein n=1 Tax=Oceanobacillus manasiensis TaxID=586413 RepID=UPI0005A84F84|nr:class II aldolase/adducin family protein [Oceanobacillus manasiensis]